MQQQSANPQLDKTMQRLIAAKEWYNEMLAGRVISALTKNSMTGIYVKTKEEALEKALSLIPKGSNVGSGGSLTLDQIGLLSALRKTSDYHFIDRSASVLTEEEDNKLRRETMLADVFLMSTNALTLDGKLVNVDGTGNRVAALCYGPTKVIIITGVNKIVPDQEAAIRRIKEYVAPIHARRRGRPLPCAKTGTCMDCRGTERSCNMVTIIENQRHKDRITVIICGEELGL